MTRLNEHGTELARTEYTDCRIAIMSDGSVLRNQGAGWKSWKRVKVGIDPIAFAAKMQASYDALPAEFHAYVRALVAACDLEHRAQLNALVDQMSEDPDVVWSGFADSAYGLDVEDVGDAAALGRP
jgi:LPS sulfotransferase NodH